MMICAHFDVLDVSSAKFSNNADNITSNTLVDYLCTF